MDLPKEPAKRDRQQIVPGLRTAGEKPGRYEHWNRPFPAGEIVTSVPQTGSTIL